MIVQPSPTGPRSGARRTLHGAGIALPAVLLVSIVAAGLLGSPTGEPAVAPASQGSASASQPAAVAAGTPTAAIDGPDALFPGVVTGLAVRSIGEARAALTLDPSGPMAVAGYLAAVVPTGICARGSLAPDPLGPLCERVARLVSTTNAGVGTRVSNGDAGMLVRLPVAVTLPAAASPATATPVVIVGRATSDSCAPGDACQPAFTADLVAWAAGAAADASLVVDHGIGAVPPARMLRNRHAAESLVTGWSGTVLVSAVVGIGTVEMIDAAAASTMDRSRAPDGIVWYARAIETAYGSMRYPSGDVPPRVSWVILDDATGNAVAWGAG
jgi:hypothetical protein